MPPVWRTVLLITFGILVSACTGAATVDDAGRAAPGPAEGAASDASAPLDGAGSGAGAPESITEPAPFADRPLPFDALLEELFGTTDTDAYLAHAERQAAELVVDCMAEAGFEFVIEADPNLPPLRTPSPTADIVRTEGFGVISGFLRQFDDFDPGAAAAVDQANSAYVGTLDAAEIERFFSTLDGDEPAPGQVATNTGCTGQARDTAFAQWDRFSEALPGYQALTEERDTHPRWLAARMQWQDCMLARGFDYREPDAVESDVTVRMRELVSETYPGGELPLVVTAQGFDLDPAVETLLAEVQQFEIDAAVADFDCTQPVADEFEAVEHEVQREFVDRNRTAINELLANR